MKYKLHRQDNNPELKKILSREIKKQRIYLRQLSKAHVKDLVNISKEIQKQTLPKNLVRKKLPNNLGYGIFLHPKAKPIPRGTVIGLYSGKADLVPQNAPDDSSYAFAPISDIILSKEEQKLFDSKRRYHPKRVYWFNIDAQYKGNFTRYINHSEKPNITAELVTIPRNPYGFEPAPLEVLYLAKKAIQPGEQLLVCYEDEEKSYWGAVGIEPFFMTPQTFTLSDSMKIIKKNT